MSKNILNTLGQHLVAAFDVVTAYHYEGKRNVNKARKEIRNFRDAYMAEKGWPEDSLQAIDEILPNIHIELMKSIQEKHSGIAYNAQKGEQIHGIFSKKAKDLNTYAELYITGQIETYLADNAALKQRLDAANISTLDVSEYLKRAPRNYNVVLTHFGLDAE